MTVVLKRRLTAALLIVGAIAAILLPFIAGTLVTLVIGGIAFSVGVGQLLQLGQENNTVSYSLSINLYRWSSFYSH